MDLNVMRNNVRRDLGDEGTGNYRWSDDDLDRHILRAVKELSEAVPLPVKASLPTTPGSRDLDISALADRVTVDGIEYPIGQFPPHFQQFSMWGDALTISGEDVPDGSNAAVYYGRVHTLDDNGSTIPNHLEDLVAAGAAGYAAVEQAAFAVNRVNTGGTDTPNNFESWGRDRLDYFRGELRRLGRRNRVRCGYLYQSILPGPSHKTDHGP